MTQTSPADGLDAATRDFLRRTRTRGRQPLSGLSVQQARQFPSWFELLFGPAPALARMRHLSVPALDGTPLHARLYADDPAADCLVVYFHGGGWVLGSVAAFEPYTALLAQRTGTAVLSVDYRLAPEHPFPTPVDDAEAALRFGAAEGARLLGRPLRRLVVMGDSAGATLATVAARRLAAAAGTRGADLQVLVYPVTDAGFDTPSYRDFAEGYLLTAADMHWFWNHYCADPSLRMDPDASPLHGDRLHVLPPTLLFSAELDPLRDEGERYAARLREAGVDCEMQRCPGVLHSFLAMANTLPAAREAFDQICRRMRERLA
ncbi:alpha/beta hydrolase [Thiomonas sp. FB-6]|uniref:alpha/beta hydrolase n=1 Tax=Thiomonas sp. FB-6 TaxID=1158291 RepID=UPI000380CFE3|nr:alpha/beta hydrolase [Thiomonas sp. FB-6]